MAYSVDLKELAMREIEKVEWKENGDDINIVHKIVKTIAAFANDISNFGGVCCLRGKRDQGLIWLPQS